jgi:uncharacterized protein YecE (DUF72 family)
MSQLDMFASNTVDVEADRHLRHCQPGHLKIGASSFTYRGWNGVVYAGNPSQHELVERGLAEYARHPLFSTVSLDRGFYQPLTPKDFERYAQQLPQGFRCGLKVWNAITTPLDASGKVNAHFLDADAFKSTVLDIATIHFSDNLGPFLFQFPSFGAAPWLSALQFQAKLARFFAQLPRSFDYAVELREASFLTQSHFELLRQFEVAHVFNHWERMPSLEHQLSFKSPFTGRCVVSRVLLPQGRGYEEQRQAFEPFDKLIEVDNVMRRQVLTLIERTAAANKVLYLFVGNKAEGSSPLTIRGLLEATAARTREQRRSQPE